ncbi:MAG: Na+/H+-dicarboxylate symporter [Polaribacter sp.]|jgi:Na+/H+-dicarboxylate symporter
MKDIHSYWAYLVLAILIFAVVNAIIGFTQKKQFTDKDVRIGLFTLIVAHIQLLIGLVWYFMSPWYEMLKTDAASVMKDKAARLLAVEHPIMMILAIVFITIGWSKHKKKIEDIAKFKTFAIFYGIALLLILSKIPWSNWF